MSYSFLLILLVLMARTRGTPQPSPAKESSKRKASEASSSGKGQKKKKSKKTSEGTQANPIDIDIRCFDNEDQHRAFKEVFMKRGIMSGRIVRFESFERKGPSILPYFDSMGWTNACSVHLPNYPILVRLFYTNLILEENGSLSSLVKGREFNISEEYLGNILECPCDGIRPDSAVNRKELLLQVFGRSDIMDIDANMLTLEQRLLHHIVCRVLIPKSGSFHFVSTEQLMFISHLLTGTAINLPSFILSYMVKAYKSRGQLPYGNFLTKIFIDQSVDMEHEVFVAMKHGDIYDENSIIRMNYKWSETGWVKKTDTTPTKHIEVEKSESSASQSQSDDSAGQTPHTQGESRRKGKGIAEESSQPVQTQSMSAVLERMDLMEGCLASRLEGLDRKIEDIQASAPSVPTVTPSLDPSLFDEFASRFTKQFESLNLKVDSLLAQPTPSSSNLASTLNMPEEQLKAEIFARMDKFEASIDKRFTTLEKKVEEIVSKSDVSNDLFELQVTQQNLRNVLLASDERIDNFRQAMEDRVNINEDNMKKIISRTTAQRNLMTVFNERLFSVVEIGKHIFDKLLIPAPAKPKKKPIIDLETNLPSSSTKPDSDTDSDEDTLFTKPKSSYKPLFKTTARKSTKPPGYSETQEPSVKKPSSS